MWSLPALLLSLPVVYAAQAPTFAPPSGGPLIASPNLGGKSNTTLSKPTIVPGKQFDRFIQIWLENTDFDTANSSATFRTLSSQGITLTSYYALTHPSEPNYVASVGGDFFGMHDDDLYNIPANISTIVDLLEDKNISWASYQESMPSDGFGGFNFSQPNYLNSSAPPYVYYVRKHNPLIIFDSVANVPARAALQRNFNDFAADVNASAIPQWLFVTPNLVNDAHDTTIDFASQWLEFWLMPLLADQRFNDNRTLILLTFDENETQTVNNRIFSVLLGGAVPQAMRGTEDSTYYTHYSSLSTVQANWGLGSLGRGDTNKTMSNVYGLVANAVGFKNEEVTGNAIPLTNISGPIPGALNSNAYVPFAAPNISAVGAGGGPVFKGPGLNVSITPNTLPNPVNLTSTNQTVPAAGAVNATSTAPAGSTSGGSGSASAGISLRDPAIGKAVTISVFGAIIGAAVVLL
ncbi:hypothetical protein M422DRAFT_211275 [Sphaerobolus stellatus SS14]|uniref:Acid phosphatase n=1 Tax=Sphaerobolus stellatus (strain SS14) TaxID=990650 RepID=A0A0C9U3S6_SPHS4|nr:hypothetical protein M422DRAFT_211275 [Sphaerobolus stellatus SS14]